MTRSLDDLFRDELSYLRLQGNAFAQRYPQLKDLLEAAGSDSDVEKLLEGFAFLNAHLRMKIEDDLPEVTEGLLKLLYPNYLRHIPSMTMMQFSPKKGAFDLVQEIPAHTSLESQQDKQGSVCTFRTTHTIKVYPLVIEQLQEVRSREKYTLSIHLQTLNDEPLSLIGCDSLDFWLSGECRTAMTLYLWLFHHLAYMELVVEGEHMGNLPPYAITPLGLSDGQALLPGETKAFNGYRLIQEYLLWPQRFCAFRIQHLDRVWRASLATKAKLVLHFNRPLPDDISLTQQDLSLYCVPAVNLFSQQSQAITLRNKVSDYALKPMHSDNPQTIFSVDAVASEVLNPDTGEVVNTQPLQLFDKLSHTAELHSNRRHRYYQITQKPFMEDSQILHTLTLSNEDGSADSHEDSRANHERITASLLCSNGQSAGQLPPGHINVPTQDSPPFVTFTNITATSIPSPPLLDERLHWPLISNLAPNYLALKQVEALQSVLRSYHFVALHDIQALRRIEQHQKAMKALSSDPIDRLIKGLPARGLESRLTLDINAFDCEGEAYLLSSILSQFLSLYASTQSFHQLIVLTDDKEHWCWPLVQGVQPVI